MVMSADRWVSVAQSEFPWEREALDFVRQRLPDLDPYRAWANFEFIDETGRINQVDLLVLTPKGFFLVEIKSRPGTLEGDTRTWTWTTDGRRFTYDNPLLLTDSKAKRLKSLLARQKACQKITIPYLTPVVFCSAEALVCSLQPAARQSVYLRDVDAAPGHTGRPGIVAGLTRWTPGAPDDPGARRVDRPTAQAIARALEAAGIRPSQRARRVGDYVLGELIEEGTTYQDWVAEHRAARGVRTRVRIFMVAPGASPATSAAVARAAEREFKILQGISHPGILRAQAFTQHERGPALVFEYDPHAERLDHFLATRAASLDIDRRITILRQIAEVLRYAHGKNLVHRALSPQSILVCDPESATPRIQILNWHTGMRLPGATAHPSGISGTLHPGQLVEDAALVYVAPEVIAAYDGIGRHADMFSLGAIAFHLFAGRPPAPSLLQRDELLRAGRGLDLAAAVDGVATTLRDLVLQTTRPEVTSRLDSPTDFLDMLELVEDELTAPEIESVLDPTEATVNDRLPGGFLVKKRLGRGSCAVTFVIERNDEDVVLKVADSVEHNDRLRGEAEVLACLRHERIVEFKEVAQVGDRVGILMAKAGEMTLGQRLRAEGRLHVELLHRFGEELLQTVQYLEEAGVAHRDIKPDNIGVTAGVAKDRLHVVLFDFSLARTPADDIRAGTRPYLDPFLALRKPPRWDLYAERFAAAMTMYEMATGTLPRWGDGQSDPAMLDVEATLDPDLFEADLRVGLSAFFARALLRDYRARFDTCEEMLRAWRRIFDAAERVSHADEADRSSEMVQALSAVRADTQLALLPLSTRAQTAMERLGLLTVADLLGVPVMRIWGMRGVGNKTRREIGELIRELAGRVTAEPVAVPVVAEPELEPDEAYAERRPSVDLLVNRLLPTRGRVAESDERTLRILLGLDEPTVPPLPFWPSQTDVAEARGLTRARISQSVLEGRQRWSKNPAITALREDIVTLLETHAGVMTVREVAGAILAARGSAAQDPTYRERIALAVTRAAVEAEAQRQDRRFLTRRTAASVLIAIDQEHADYADWLARTADGLATEDPLPGPRRAREMLEAVPPPAGLQPDTARLLQLASTASRMAALSSRFEIYPRGMPAARAVKLAHGAFLGAGELSVDEVRERVRSRYPDAADLPGRPELDDLLRETGWDFEWVPSPDGRGGTYRARGGPIGTVTSGSKSLSRHPSGGTPAVITPEVADARRFEDRLQHAATHGGFLALTVRPRELGLAERVLTEHFRVECRSLEGALLCEMRVVADAMRSTGALCSKQMPPLGTAAIGTTFRRSSAARSHRWNKT